MLRAERAEFEGAYLDFTSKFSKLLSKSNSTGGKKRELTGSNSTQFLKANQATRIDTSSEIENLLSKIAQKDQEIQELKAANVELTEQLEKRYYETEHLKRQLNDTIDQKECMIQDLQCMMKEYESQMRDYHVYQCKIDDTQSEIVKLMDRLQESEAQNSELSYKIKAMNANFNSNINAPTSQSDSRDSALVQENKVLLQQLESFKSQVAALSTEIESLRAKSLSSVKNDSQDAQISSLKAELEEAMLIREQLTNELQRCLCQMNDLQKNNCRLQMMNEELKLEIKELAQKLVLELERNSSNRS